MNSYGYPGLSTFFDFYFIFIRGGIRVSYEFVRKDFIRKGRRNYSTSDNRINIPIYLHIVVWMSVNFIHILWIVDNKQPVLHRLTAKKFVVV
jgi:hypothetical protein